MKNQHDFRRQKGSDSDVKRVFVFERMNIM